MRLPLSLAFLLAACGGTTIDIPDDGGGGADGTTGDGGGGNDGGANDATFDGPVPHTCDDLSKQIASAQADAQKCCPTCKSLQCQSTAQGVCCPIAVQDAQRGQQLSALVQQYKTQCHPLCPAIPCAAPLMQCDPDTSLCR